MSKYIVYKTTNLINNKIYIGVHKRNDSKNIYLGSGIVLTKAIKKYGKKNFIRETLFEFKTKKEAYEKEKEIVNEQFVDRKDTYNMKTGGFGNGVFYSKLVNVKDKNGNTSRVSINDPRYLSGELIPIVSGEGNPMYGKKQSKESKLKNRLAHLGKVTSEETKEKLRKSLSGENAPNFIGYYITPVGNFVSLQDGQNAIGIPTKTLSRFCIQYQNKKISNRSYTDSKFLKTLGSREKIVGKTFSEIGFGLQEKHQPPV